MNRLLTLLSVAALGVFALCACNGNGTQPETPESGNGKDTLLDLLRAEDKLYQDMTINSTVLNKKMTYSVWLPGGYDESKTYPFLYLLHGYESGDQTHLDRCWVEKGNARAIAKDYVKDGGVPMVIIMPNGLSMFYSGTYEDYMHKELFPEVEKLYKCNGKRAIAGLSMGGFGTTYHALKYPEKFTYAYAMSPAVSGDMKVYVDAKADKSVFPGFTFEVGNQDTTVNNDNTKSLADYMTEKGLKVEYIARDGYHFWNFWQECLPKALKKAGESFK